MATSTLARRVISKSMRSVSAMSYGKASSSRGAGAPLASHIFLTSVVIRTDGFLEAEIDDEIVALSIAKGTCYGFNRVASRIWALLASSVRVRDLIATLLTEYQVDPIVCERQVLDLLEELRAEGMIATVERE